MICGALPLCAQHVWLLWAAHLNGHDAKQAKVKAPHLRGGKAGVFATRSPYRPNPIGLSLVRLEAISSGDTLRLSGVDLVDGTPILDVKPYLPQYDAPQTDSLQPIRTASWVDPPALGDIRFTPEAEAALKVRRRNEGGSGSKGRGCLTTDEAQLKRALVQTLAADPRPVYRWRREQQAAVEGGEAAEYDLALDGCVARCRFARGPEGAEYVEVLSLRSSGPVP